MVRVTAVLEDTQRKTLEAMDSGLARWQRAIEDAAEHGAVDAELRERLAGTLRALAQRANEGMMPPFDPEAASEIRGRLLNLLTLPGDDDRGALDVADEALMGAEAVRHVVRDVLDGRPAAVASTRDQLEQVQSWLPRLPVTELARLLGVERRTVSRMRDDTGAPSARLELVWKLVAILRRSWTDDGVLAWFDRPRTAFDGRSPIDLLDDRALEVQLVDLARRGRTQRAS